MHIKVSGGGLNGFFVCINPNMVCNQLNYVVSQLSVDEDLVYLNGARIVLPKNAVRAVLLLVHTAHIGMNKTYELCRSLYFWPGMYDDIKQMIAQL